MTPLDIYLTGVGGQGIGLLSDLLSRAAMAAGYHAVGTDTHGLAQRGGTVVSHLRIGDARHRGPVIPQGRANVAAALERLEAMRALNDMLAPSGRLFYCDAVYQPIAVRMGSGRYPETADIASAAQVKKVSVTRIDVAALPDPKLQNTLLLSALIREGAIAEIRADHVVTALKAVLKGPLLEANLALFLSEVGGK